jgi:hypothetical protein
MFDAPPEAEKGTFTLLYENDYDQALAAFGGAAGKIQTRWEQQDRRRGAPSRTPEDREAVRQEAGLGLSEPRSFARGATRAEVEEAVMVRVRNDRRKLLAQEKKLFEEQAQALKDKIEAAQDRIAIAKRKMDDILSGIEGRKFVPDPKLDRWKKKYDEMIEENRAFAQAIDESEAATSRQAAALMGLLTKEERDMAYAEALAIIEDNRPFDAQELNVQEASQRRDDLIMERKRNQDEIQKMLDDQDQLRDSDDPNDIEKIEALEQRIEEMRFDIAVQSALIDDARFRVLAEMDEATVKAVLQTSSREKSKKEFVKVSAILDQAFERQLAAIKDMLNLTDAMYIPNKPKPDPRRKSGSPSYGKTLSIRKQYFRTGNQARAGDVDRSVDAYFASLQDMLRTTAYRNIMDHLMIDDVVKVNIGNGVQHIFAENQRDLVEAEGVYFGQDGKVFMGGRLGSRPGRLVSVPARVFNDPSKLMRAMQTTKVDPKQDFATSFELAIRDLDMEEAEAEVRSVGEPLSDAEFRRQVELRAQAIAREGEGLPVVYIREAAVRRLWEQEQALSGKMWKALEELNSWASRLVLGTSFSWAFAQPIAEFLVLAADNPRVIPDLVKLARRRKALMKKGDIESARLLSYFSDSTLGADTASRRMSDMQRNAGDSIREMRDQTWMGYQLKMLAELRTLGNIDKLKGAWIREVGVLAKLDQELSFLTRAAKAVKGQMDEIEKVADKLKGMTDAQRLRFLDSKEGRAAGDRIIELIDESLGNWTKLSPAERKLANVVFFYPFVRFSMNWTLRTFPKNHPYRWTLAAMLGIANAEILEEYLEQPPAFASGWATIPIWADGEGPPSHFLAVNRIAPGGNSIVELVGDFQSPFDLLRLTTPPLAVAGRLIAGRDRWGNPIKSEEDGIFSDNTPSPGDMFASTMDELTDLSPFSREFKRYLGLTIEGPFSRDFKIKVTKGDDARAKQPGDDPNMVTDVIRRLAFPFVIPRTYDQIKAEYTSNNLWEMYGEANDFNSREYSEKAKRGIKKLEEMESVVAAHGERTHFAEYFQDVRAVKAFKKNDPDYQQYLKESDTKAEAEQIMRRVARAITKLYKGTNSPLESSERFKDYATTEEQHRKDIRDKWLQQRPGFTYPGYETALKNLRRWDDKSPRKSTGPGDPGIFAPKPAKLENINAGRTVRLELQEDTQKFLAKKGGAAKTDITNPLSDPRTKVKKNGEVSRYRGRKVMGNVKLASVRAAEQSNSLTIDKKTGMLMTPDVRQTYMHAINQNDIVRELLKEQSELRQQASPSSGLGGDEGRFVEELARISGLSPRVVAAWTKLEGGNSFGDWNRLNIGHTDSGPIALTADPRWSDPVEAARLTNSFLKGEFGGPSEEIKAILPNAVGKSDQEQINIITTSGWATDPEYSTKVAEVYNGLPEGQPADPKAAKKLKKINEEVDQAEQAADKLYDQARKQGIPVPRPADGPSNEVLGPKKTKGPYAGSRRIVSQILGQPVWGDKYGTDSSRSGYHWLEDAYAQDIQLNSGNPSEGEPVYNQALLDQITQRIRSMGGQVPDLVMGMGQVAGYLRGYELEIIPDSETNVHGTGAHLHIGARWTGDKPPPGTVFGSGGSGGAGISSASSAGSGVSLPAVGGGGSAGPMNANNLMSLPLGSGGEDPQDLPSVIDSMSQAEGDGVESVVDQLGALPMPKKKRKPLPKFNPSTRI